MDIIETTHDSRLYTELAEWWPLFSPPSQYADEAEDLLPLLLSGPGAARAHTLLELGSGGGSLAYHLKHRFALTLTDRSPQMLAVNKRINPECEHIVGDMTTLDVGRQFDCVLVHDAIMYAITPDAVRATIANAARHCRIDGVAVFLPDCVQETYVPATTKGGEDGDDGRGLRHLQWRWDPDPADCTYEVGVSFLMREADGRLLSGCERHRFGCFPRADWVRWFREAGFQVRIHHDPWRRDVFVGVKRG